MQYTGKIDLFEKAWELSLEQYRESPNLKALIKAIIDNGQPFEEACGRLMEWANAEKAEGAWLDVIGKIRNLPREAGETDRDYRSRIRERAKEILVQANARHAARAAKERARIQEAWTERVRIRREARDILKEFEGITVPAKTELERSLAKAHAPGVKAFTESLRSIKKNIDGMDRIENPWEAVRKYGYDDVAKAQREIEKKFKYLSQFDIDKQIKKLEYEIGFVEKNKAYTTWELAKKAYEQGLAAAKIQKAAAAASAKIHALELAAKAAKDRTLTGYVNKLKKAGTPATQNELDALEKLVAAAEARAVKARPATPGPGDYYTETEFRESTAAQRKIRFISKTGWKKKDAEVIDACAKDVWQKATLEQKQAAYYYTEGSSANNEPLYGVRCQGTENDPMEAVTKHNPNLTRLIDGTALPNDTWLRSGQAYGTITGIFGIDLAGKIQEVGDEVRDLIRKKKVKPTANVEKVIATTLTARLQGTTGTQAAFMSTSFAKDAGFKTKDLNFEIFAPKGTKCLYAEPFSKYGDRDTSPTKWDGMEKTAELGYDAEFEGILQRGTKFKFLGIEYDPKAPSDEPWTVKMEIIGQAPKPYQPGNPVKY